MEKEAQLQISFGMIFSIIIIIATVGIASYIIVQFFSLQENINCNLFQESLQNRIDEAWHSDRARETFKGNVPASTKYVCFGNESSPVLNRIDSDIKDEFGFHLEDKNAVYFYPASSCGEGDFKFELEHIKTKNFFCVPVKGGSVSLKIEYDITRDTFVSLNP